MKTKRKSAEEVGFDEKRIRMRIDELRRSPRKRHSIRNNNNIDGDIESKKE